MSTDQQAVMDALQRGYGDATQGVLDAKVASDILRVLRERGWASLSDVASVILAAGGEVVVTPKAQRDGLNAEVFASEDYASGGRKFIARTKENR